MPRAGEPVAWMAMAVDDRGQADDRADRDVEPAGDDHHGLAHRQHAEDGDGEADIEQVARGEEHVAAQRAEDRDEHGERDQQADVVDADAVDEPAMPRPACRPSLAADRLVDAVHWTAPSCWAAACGMACFRIAASLMSGRVEFAGDAAAGHDQHAVGEADQLRHLRGDQHDGDAARRQLVDQPVDLGLGADVDAARRLVEDEQHRLPRQPARQHHLLLVAAGQLETSWSRLGRLDRHLQRRAARRCRAPCGGRTGRSDDVLSGTHSVALSRMLRNSSSASCLRSSGAKPMPAAIAACGLSALTAAPFIDDRAAEPAVDSRRSPWRARSGRRPSGRRCRRPRPCAPTRLTSLTFAVVSPFTSSSVSPRAPAVAA